jgi:hypothetical protein
VRLRKSSIVANGKLVAPDATTFALVVRSELVQPSSAGFEIGTA